MNSKISLHILLLVILTPFVTAIAAPEYHVVELWVDRTTSDFLDDWSNVVMIKTNRDINVFHTFCYHAIWNKEKVQCGFFSPYKLNESENITVLFNIYPNINSEYRDWVECHGYSETPEYCEPGGKLENKSPIISQTVSIITHQNEAKKFLVQINTDDIKLEPLKDTTISKNAQNLLILKPYIIIFVLVIIIGILILIRLHRKKNL